PDGGGIRIAPKTIANWIINKRIDIGKIPPEELLSLISQKSQSSTFSDEELEKAIKEVILGNPKAIADYKSGKQEALMFLIGQIMRATKGKAEAGKMKAALMKLLS
ncbi:MAG: hypothetical protein Q8N98_01815, partial [bacterium]|nr:hypothetical protein [bacterium]